MASEHHQAFLRFLRRRVGSEQIAEDILQDAYVKGLAKAGCLRDDEKVVAWFYRLLRNALVDHYRRAAAESRALEQAAAEPALQPEALDRELDRAVCECVGQVVKTLRPQYEQILTQVELEGKRLKDLGERGAASPATLAVRLHRARQSLKKRLLETCGTCAEHACVNCSCRRV
ncbi:MAG: sigma-70 family RNA polymerase sigma factor [Candidatus Methylomirabilales bacterium]